MSAEYLSALLGIIVINLVVSGDNAVVIGMAAHRLPPHQRRIAIVIGGSAAIVLRVALTAVASFLLTLPLLEAIGGVLLLVIAFKLLKEEEETNEGIDVATTMRGAITTILIADLVMSLDNVLAVAAAAHGDFTLLFFGLVVSMGFVMLGGALAASLISRFWWMVYVGAGVIAWVGAEMIAEDPLLERAAPILHEDEWAIAAVVTVAVLGLAHYVHRHRPARRREAERQAAAALTEALDHLPANRTGPQPEPQC